MKRYASSRSAEERRSEAIESQKTSISDFLQAKDVDDIRKGNGFIDRPSGSYRYFYIAENPTSVRRLCPASNRGTSSKHTSARMFLINLIFLIFCERSS